MSYDLGSVVPLSVTVTNSSGAPENAGAVVVTVTLPDGTTATPSVTNPQTGVYNADYPTAQAGRHVVRWVATGVNASAFTDMFDVLDADPYQIVSLADSKEQLNIPAGDTSHDAELMGFVRSATGVVEQYVGAVVRRTWTETFDGGCTSRLLLGHTPVLSMTSVVERGVTLSASDYSLHGPSGVLTRVTGGYEIPWLYGVAAVQVVYQAGRTSVEANWRQAGLIIIEHLWETQRGPQRGPYDQQGDDFDPRYAYSIPRRALELLGEPIGGIA